MIQPSTAQPTTIATTVPPKKTLRIKAAIWGSFQLKVQILFVKLSDTQKKLRQRVCLIFPGYMQKVKRSMDFILKKSIAKFSRRSKRFAKLVADVNICIVLKNERSLKKLLVKTKINSFSGKDWESTVINFGL